MHYLAYAAAVVLAFYFIRYLIRLAPGVVRRIRVSRDNRLYYKAFRASMKKNSTYSTPVLTRGRSENPLSES